MADTGRGSGSVGDLKRDSAQKKEARTPFGVQTSMLDVSYTYDTLAVPYTYLSGP